MHARDENGKHTKARKLFEENEKTGEILELLERGNKERKNAKKTTNKEQ